MLVPLLFCPLVAAATPGCSSSDEPAPGPPGVSPGASGDGGTIPGPDGAARGRELDPLGPEFVDLGQVGPEFELDVPPGTLGFFFDPEAADVVRVKDPAGKEYTTSSHPAGIDANYLGLNRFPAMSHMVDVPPGKWQVTLSQASPVKVARQRTSDGKFHGGLLDLYVYLPTGIHAEDSIVGIKPGEVVNAANAEANPVIAAFVTHFFAEAKRLLDLDRGKLKFTDVAASYLDIASEDAAAQAATVGARSGKVDLGIHLLFTENLIDPQTQGIAVVRGGVRHDRPENTVIVNIRDIGTPISVEEYRSRGFVSGDITVHAALHEAGHLLGLAHTSVPSVTTDDGFTETPNCPQETMTAKSWECPDAPNVMFPGISTPTAKLVFTPHQLAVLRGTTFYRPYAPAK
jgi:hypothetical protein